MKKLILVNDFLERNLTRETVKFIEVIPFVQTEFGEEASVGRRIPGIDKLFSDFLGSPYRVENSGEEIFRKPSYNIHYESFNTTDDWVFINALKPTTFNLFTSKMGAENALEDTDLPFKDFTQWNYTTNILLGENDGLFFRPWLFHSIQGGLIQYYRLTK